MAKITRKQLQFFSRSGIIRILNNTFVIESGDEPLSILLLRVFFGKKSV